MPAMSPSSLAEKSGLGAALAALAVSFGARFTTSRASRAQHSHTTTWGVGAPPDAVVFPQSTSDVQAIVRICAKHRVPVVPFGAGTSFEGQVNAPHGGVSIDLKGMNKIIEVNSEDFDCVVEPGVTRKFLDDTLRDKGLFFSVDPGANASVGGMTSTRASGTRAVRYGTMKDNVLALKVVLANGEVMATSRRARKSSAGYDLTQLFVGAEGTLGIITEITLKLHSIPEATSAGVCRFPTIQASCNAAIMAMQNGIPMARVELLDEMQIRVCNVHSKLMMPEVPTLFVEFHGSPASVDEQSKRFAEIARDFGGGPFEWATGLEERNRLWQTRHDVFWGLKSYRAGAQVVVTDVCVPISRLAECVTVTKADIEQSGIVAPIVAHVGDGNFHASVLVMMDDPHEVAQTKSFIERVAERALAMEGTCTGEHGIGEAKKHLLVAEHGDVAINAMRAIKQALDPQGIMNPGKIV